MSNIVITESQYKRLFEAAMDGFSLEQLSNIRSFRDRLAYCKQMLGPSIRKGSSRIVFQIDDEKVLKLAMNRKGVAQNEAEGTPNYAKDDYDLFPKKYEYDENFTWIVSEYVLPAKEEDFQQVLGMSSKEFFNIAYNIWFERCGYNARFNYGRYKKIDDMEAIWEMTDNYDSIFYEISSYFGDFDDVDSVSINDFLAIQNWGLAIRNGEPWLVLLDSGLREEIWNTYYKRR